MDTRSVNIPFSAAKDLAGLNLGLTEKQALLMYEWAARYGAFQQEGPARLSREEMLRRIKDGEAFATSGAEARFIADSDAGVYDEDAPSPAPVEAAPIQDAAQKIRHAIAELGSVAGSKTQPWTGQEDQQLLRLVEVEKKTAKQAADILGRSPRTCEQRLAKLRKASPDEDAAEVEALPTAAPVAKVAPAPAPVAAEAPEPPAAPEPVPDEVARPVEARAGIPALNGVVPEPPRERPRLKVKDAMTYYFARSREFFTPRNDYTLMTRLMRGDRVTEIADDCGLPARVIQERSRDLIPVSLRDRNGNLSIEGGPIALEALRRIVHGERP